MAKQGGNSAALTVEQILAGLNACGGDTGEAAEELGLSLASLRWYLRKYPDLLAAATSADADAIRKDQARKKKKEEQEAEEKAAGGRKQRLSVSLAEQKLLELILEKDSRAIMFYLSTKGKSQGYTTARPVVVTTSQKERQKARKIIKLLLEKKISVFDAALQFEYEGIPLPETVKVMLSRAEQPSDAVDDGYSVFSDEEFMKRLQERNEALQKQFDGLGKRREEVARLRESVADSFSAADVEKEA